VARRVRSSVGAGCPKARSRSRAEDRAASSERHRDAATSSSRGASNREARRAGPKVAAEPWSAAPKAAGSSSARTVPKVAAANYDARIGQEQTPEWNDAALRLALNGVARRSALSGAAADRRAALDAAVAQKREAAALAGVGLGTRVAPARAAAVGQEVAGRGAASSGEAADRQ
jgi:hypothetical protein